MRKEKVVIASGYFDPLHVGHVEYLNMAKTLGDTLVVIINNDEQAKLKKGESFMHQDDRMEIIFNLELNINCTYEKIHDTFFTFFCCSIIWFWDNFHE